MPDTAPLPTAPAAPLLVDARQAASVKADGISGFWRLPHEHLAACLARADLSWELARVYLALADLTLGYGKARDVVSIGQVAEHAGMYAVKDRAKCPDYPHVARALRRLAKLGLSDSAPGKGQSMTRWVVWPPPPMPTTAAGGNTATAGSSTTAVGGRGTTAKTTATAGRHQDTKNYKKKKDTKKGAAKTDSPPTPSDFELQLVPEQNNRDGHAAYRLTMAWGKAFRERVGRGLTSKPRGKVAGIIKYLLGGLTEADLADAVSRWFGRERKDYGVELFKIKVEGADAELTGRAAQYAEDPLAVANGLRLAAERQQASCEEGATP